MSAIREEGFLCAGISRVGRRAGNEDAAAVWTDPSGKEPVRGYAIVCDGMGGHNAGEVASNMTVRFLQKTIEEWSASLRNADLPPVAEIVRTVETWVRDINLQIRNQGTRNPDQHGMGTTLAMVLALRDGHLIVTNIGDSKIFHLQGLRVRQLSVDHTAIAEQRRALNLDSAAPEDLAGNPFAHALTRSLGQEDSAQPDINPSVIFKQGDLVILTSDGVTDVLESERFMTAVETSASIEEVAEAIYRASYDAGSKDNITVVLMSYGKPARLAVALSKHEEGNPLDSTRPLIWGTAGPPPAAGATAPAAAPAPRLDRESTPRPARTKPSTPPKASNPLVPIVVGLAVLLVIVASALFWVMRSGPVKEGPVAAVPTTAPPTVAPTARVDPTSLPLIPTLPAVLESSPTEPALMPPTPEPAIRRPTPVTISTISVRVPDLAVATPAMGRTAKPATPTAARFEFPTPPPVVAAAPVATLTPAVASPTAIRVSVPPAPSPTASLAGGIPVDQAKLVAVLLLSSSDGYIFKFTFKERVNPPDRDSKVLLSGCKLFGLEEFQARYHLSADGGTSLLFLVRKSTAGTKNLPEPGKEIRCSGVSGPFSYGPFPLTFSSR